ncbi:hypothetical protein GWK47_024382 [Chionoecetes opilio]|uniref:Uncharacterized protein n=1 Tax=Chionoecetes opilio TaxID=41210 RepID=A0A8J5CDR6_CHIOP|nr:hypothetical protein GWK47_024382 [Chionoecetes opilio]
MRFTMAKSKKARRRQEICRAARQTQLQRRIEAAECKAGSVVTAPDRRGVHFKHLTSHTRLYQSKHLLAPQATPSTTSPILISISREGAILECIYEQYTAVHQYDMWQVIQQFSGNLRRGSAWPPSGNL